MLIHVRGVLFSTPSIPTMPLTTELDAINTLLIAVGQNPVASLEVSGVGDLAKARQVLLQVSRKVQAKRRPWNTEKALTLSKAVDGTVPLPNNCVALWASTKSAEGFPMYGQAKVTAMDGKLYDLINHSYTFPNEVPLVDIQFFREWDELPEPAAQYIAARAAREFVQTALGDTAITNEMREEEGMTMRTLHAFEINVAKANMLTDSYSTFGVLERTPH
jgi:hypothetical protein